MPLEFPPPSDCCAKARSPGQETHTRHVSSTIHYLQYGVLECHVVCNDDLSKGDSGILDCKQPDVDDGRFQR